MNQISASLLALIISGNIILAEELSNEVVQASSQLYHHQEQYGKINESKVMFQKNIDLTLPLPLFARKNDSSSGNALNLYQALSKLDLLLLYGAKPTKGVQKILGGYEDVAYCSKVNVQEIRPLRRTLLWLSNLALTDSLNGSEGYAWQRHIVHTQPSDFLGLPEINARETMKSIIQNPFLLNHPKIVISENTNRMGSYNIFSEVITIQKNSWPFEWLGTAYGFARLISRIDEIAISDKLQWLHNNRKEFPSDKNRENKLYWCKLMMDIQKSLMVGSLQGFQEQSYPYWSEDIKIDLLEEATSRLIMDAAIQKFGKKFPKNAHTLLAVREFWRVANPIPFYQLAERLTQVLVQEHSNQVVYQLLNCQDRKSLARFFPSIDQLVREKPPICDRSRIYDKYEEFINRLIEYYDYVETGINHVENKFLEAEMDKVSTEFINAYTIYTIDCGLSPTQFQPVKQE